MTVSAPAEDLRVEWRDIASVIPYHKQLRKHRRAVEKVADSLRTFGWRQPLVIDHEGVIVVGDVRYRAAMLLGWTRVPVPVALGLSAAQVRAYRLADNRTAEEATWDDPVLAAELMDLSALEVDLGITGFDPQELADLNHLLTAALEQGAIDDAPPPPAVAITQLGDVITLGRHRLVCGDSTSAAAWDALMCGEAADLVWTDPPYGIAYVGKTKDALTIENDALDAAQLTDFLQAALSLAWGHCRPGAAWYVASPAGPLHQVFGHVLTALGVWRQSIQWIKDAFVLGRSDYHYRNESIFYGWKEGAAHYFVADRTQDTVWECPRPRQNAEHPTMKPVALVQRAVENSSRVGGIVVDPFGGSGTTLLASEVTGRCARLLELSPQYCDVICTRWEALTGGTVSRERAGGLTLN